MTIINLAAYQFQAVKPDTLFALRDHIKAFCRRESMKGLIIISPEGINLMVATTEHKAPLFKDYMEQHTPFCGISYKESFSNFQPFSRMIVKAKSHAIPFSDDAIHPEQKTAQYITPKQLKQWYDEGRDMLVLDTRNDYEIKVGSFDNAIHFNIKKFTQFTKAAKQLVAQNKPIITFCTGGIRCEKAATWLAEQGHQQVYQLQGGILEYFKECHDAHYHGECFVFDKRVAIDANLQQTKTIQCYACRNPLTLAEQQTCQGVCPYCAAKITHLSIDEAADNTTSL